MNPLEIFNFLRDLVQRGADVIASFLVGVLVAVIALHSWIDRWNRARVEEEVRQLRGKVDDALKEKDAGDNARKELVAKYNQLVGKYKAAKGAVQSLRSEQSSLEGNVEALQIELAESKAVIQSYTEELEAQRDGSSGVEEERRALLAENEKNAARILWAKKKIRGLEDQIRSCNDQLLTAASTDGQVWMKSAQNVPPFVPLGRRGMPIISLFNFKGGVGKTTIAANLAGTLANAGNAVLLVDLDYQGNLTKLCIDERHRQDLERAERFVHKVFQPTPSIVEEFRRNITQISDTGCHIVCANNKLNGVEMQVMARWLVDANQEARYNLRKALHSQEIQDEYDYVLLDCPPRFTTACINALTSSDYIIVPVQLDAISVATIPELLDSLKVLRDANVCPDLEILGILANATTLRGGDLIGRESKIWQDLPQKCADKWHKEVYHFEATIPRSGVFSEAASLHDFASSYSGLKSVFLDLTREIKQRIPSNASSGAAIAH